MRTNRLLLGLMVAGALFSCTNDDAEFETPSAGEVEKSYIAINVNSAYDLTRASDYEDGTEKEKKVNNAIFFFFDNAGNPFNVSEQIGGTGKNYIVKNNLGETSSNSENIETITEAVLTIQSNKGTNPAKVVTVLNWEYDGESVSLSDLKSTLVDAATATDDAKGFIMSNSVYMSGADIMDATPITAANIATNANAANSIAVQVYVERLAAKVAVSTAEESSVYDTGIENPLAPGTNFHVKVVNWGLNTTISHTNMVKTISPAWTDGNLGIVGWNIEAYKRSFWGTSVPVEGNVSLTENFSWNGIEGAVNAPEYCLENTSGENTKVLVKAQLCDDRGNAIEVVKFLGDYITIDGLKNMIASALADKYYKYDGSAYISILPEDIDLAQAGTSGVDSYTVTYKLTSAAEALTWKVKNSDGTSYSDATATVVNDVLATLTPAQVWKNGMAYYFTDIKHLGSAGKTAEYGVVRNHSYTVNITAITGLGTPVYDPSNDIEEPVTPTDTESFISAQINVLSWRLVNSNVVLK